MTKFGQVYIKAMTIGQRIRQLREEAGMKQRELAAKLDIGEGFLSKIENDQKLLKREDLKKLSNLFNVAHADLETLWLANKVYDLIRNENQGLDALKVAEEQIKYSKDK
ncbi:helix-turn-helix transcriptional regulator [Riemerella anatipestifer]|nr:helix-turn-helix transcriptional regulator [Riemerella anatipestifer]